MRSNRPSVRGRVAAALAALIFTVQLPAESPSYDWPQFRGAQRDGVSRETGLTPSWPDEGPREVWRIPLGEGYSGVSVVGDRVYTLFAGEHDGQPTEFAAAFNAADGKELWRTPIGTRHDTEFGNGPRSTPTVDGDTVYVLGSLGDFAALATKDGSRRWGMKLTETFGSKQPHWGFSTSALVDGDHVIIEGGGEEGAWAAIDKKTGDVKWKVGDTPPGYNSALSIDMGGKHRYVYLVREKLMAVDRDGKEVWSHPWPQGETHASPVFIPPDKIFASGVEDVGATLLRVNENGAGSEVEEVWKTRYMRNHFSSSVVHGDHIYGFDNATLKAIAVEDAKLAWAKRGIGKGSMILADGHLIVLSDRGQLLLVEASPAGYVEKGAFQALEGLCWTAPTLANGRLYLRNHDEMVVFDLKG